MKKKSYPIKVGIYSLLYTIQIESNFHHAYLFKSRVPSPTLRKFSFTVFDTFVTSKVTVMVGDGGFEASLVNNSIIFCNLFSIKECKKFFLEKHNQGLCQLLKRFITQDFCA